MTDKKEIFSSNNSISSSGLFKLYIYFRTYRLIKKEQIKLKLLENTINTIINEYEKAIENKLDDNIKLFNISLYILTVDRDISSLKFMMMTQTDNWNLLYLSRQLAVLLYESTDDLLTLLGKDFKGMFDKLSDKELLLYNLKEITKEFSVFKKNNIEYLKEIRNNCGAHRDENAYKQLMTISKIDSKTLVKLATEFMLPLKKLVPFIIDVMTKYTKESYIPNTVRKKA